jgi:hypothetical protein
MPSLRVPRLTRVFLITWLLLWIVFAVAPTWFVLGPIPLDPRAALPGLQLWRFLTYPFLYLTGPMGILFTLMGGFFLMPPFEARWGPWGLLRFHLATTCIGGLVAAGFALLMPFPAMPISGPLAMIEGLIVAFALVWPDAQFRFQLLIPVTARTMVWLTLLVDVLYALFYVPKGVYDPIAWLAGMGVAYVYLKHGWRMSRFAPFQALGALPGRLSRSWRRRKVRVVDRDFDRWLDKEDDHEVRH